jgi:abnormal spindle-like microcephaly-associated protein
MFENNQKLRLNYAATLIQSLWRGYVVRKEINLIQLRNIRERLSIYIQNPQSTSQHTLGYRIQRSLNVLEQKSPPIPQVILALLDFQVVTRLSKECCIQFLKAGAISTLYEFIQSCNRSTPHTDLIKLCLEVFINLSKCEDTCASIIDLDQRSEVIHSNGLNILLALLQSYHLSNSQVFMHVCVLLIILASNEKKLENFRVCLLQQLNLKKLLQLYSTLERRLNLKLKNKQRSVLTTNQDILNESVNSTTSSNSIGSTIQIFTLEPEWSLSKKSLIQLNDSHSALHYLLVNTLEFKFQNCSEACKTPNRQIVPKSYSSVKQLKQSLENLNEVPRKLGKKSIAKNLNVSIATKKSQLNNTINTQNESMFYFETKDVDS